MARSHRIGQTKRVKVRHRRVGSNSASSQPVLPACLPTYLPAYSPAYLLAYCVPTCLLTSPPSHRPTPQVFRMVTRNTYESEMVERANKKLGLERAMNADRANDGLRDGGADAPGPPQDRKEINAMLKRGAHDIFINEADDAAFQKFNDADIDSILESSSTKVPCRAVPCRAVPCRAVPCRAVPCYAVLCARPCCAMLCYVRGRLVAALQPSVSRLQACVARAAQPCASGPPMRAGVVRERLVVGLDVLQGGLHRRRQRGGHGRP